MPKGKVKKAMEKRAEYIWKHNMKDKNGIPVKKKFKKKKDFKGAYVFGGYDKKKKHLNFRDKDYIKGGLADKVRREDMDWTQLKKGTKVEMEHTKNPNIAREIASDHIKEHPKYYPELHNMEKWLELLKVTKVNPFWIVFGLGLILFLEGIFISYDWTRIGIPSIELFGYRIHHWQYGLLMLGTGIGGILRSNLPW